MSKKHEEENNDEIEFVSEESENETRRFGKSDDTLRSELAEAATQRSEYLEGWQRAKADLINFKRDAAQEGERAFSRGAASVVMDLLPVLDSFDLAFGNKEAWESAPKNWRDGVVYIHQQLLSSLKERGLEPFSPEGEEFDPQQHESTGHVPVDDPNLDGTVVNVLQKGYRMNGALIRPARVQVGEHTT